MTKSYTITPKIIMKKLQCILMTDQEADRVFAERAERLKLSCCVCEEDGWMVNDEYVPKQNMIISSCGHETHSVCVTCSSRIAAEELAQSLGAGKFMKVLKCPYPYSKDQCRGHFSRRRWEPLVPLNLLQKRTCLLGGEGFFIKCSSCHGESRSQNPESFWTCLSCNRTSCGRCDDDNCSCTNTAQDALSKGYSRNFTVRNASGQSRPLRRNEITKDMLVTRLKSLHEHYPWLHAHCPCCEVPVYKSSACNDMKHCGESHVCYICLQRSFPWEGSLPLDHWNKCPRWDHEVDWYPCREGACIQNGHECSDPLHALSIAKMHEYRLRAAIETLRVDVQALSL